MFDQKVEVTQAQVDELKTFVTGQVSTHLSVLEQHGRDESAHPPTLPSVVVSPRTTQEVSAVLAYCNSHRIPVVPFGAGTSLEGHTLPIYGGVSLDLTDMNKILEIRPEDLLVRVQTGVNRMALNEKLSSSGIFFSVDPGADATLGGMAATGAAGTTTVRYGSMRENVLALTAVLADGTIIHTGRESRKQSAGYDLTRLIVGSEGTLAVITELTLRVFGIPEKVAAAVACFPTLEAGLSAATMIVLSGVPIARCEFLDPKIVNYVNRHDNLTMIEAPTLLFEFHGSAANVVDDTETVKSIVAEFGGTDFDWATDEGARRKLWQARHNSYWATVAANPGKRVISTDAAVPLSKLAQAVAIADEILGKSGFEYTIFGHVADGNFHCAILTDPEKPEELHAIREVTHRMTSEMINLGGTSTGEHGIGIGKIESLVEEAGTEAVAVMRSIKLALDPHGILNPGKIFTARP